MSILSNIKLLSVTEKASKRISTDPPQELEGGIIFIKVRCSGQSRKQYGLPKSTNS
jgi:hypothetical protein